MLDAADWIRFGRAGITVPLNWKENRSIPVVLDGTTVREAGPTDAANAQLSLGPNPGGGHVMLRVDPLRLPSGRSFAPVVAAMARLADQLWSSGIGDLEPAIDVYPN